MTKYATIDTSTIAGVKKAERLVARGWPVPAPTLQTKGKHMNHINFDLTKLKALKQAYARALDAGETKFTFEGNPLLVTYAKYLIEYLENVLLPKG